MNQFPDKATILKALQKGELKLQGQFLNSSNYTFLGSLSFEGLELDVVYKPTRGEQPLWDFPEGTLAKREVAAYQVSEALGWDLVPATVYRRQHAPLGAGSLQQFMDYDPEYHYFNFGEEDKQRLRPVALFDLLVNNADRKAGHIFFDRQDHLWLIDHGICFHVEDKLRTVIWDFAGEPIPAGLLADLERFQRELQDEQGQVVQNLVSLLRLSEIAALRRRARYLLESGCYPTPRGSRRPYPWPPI